MPYAIAVGLLVVATVVILALMRRGWRNRERNIVVAELPALPAGTADPDAHPTPGVYVATTLAGQPYERVVARGLGAKSAVEVRVGPTGIALLRQGADDLFIPAADLQAVSTTGGMIGKVAAPDSIVVFTWRVGQTLLDTGVHIRAGAARADLLGAATALVNPNETRHP